MRISKKGRHLKKIVIKEELWDTKRKFFLHSMVYVDKGRQASKGWYFFHEWQLKCAKDSIKKFPSPTEQVLIKEVLTRRGAYRINVFLAIQYPERKAQYAWQYLWMRIIFGLEYGPTTTETKAIRCFRYQTTNKEEKKKRWRIVFLERQIMAFANFLKTLEANGHNVLNNL